MSASKEKEYDNNRGQGLKTISFILIVFLIIPFAIVALTYVAQPKLDPFDYLRQILLNRTTSSSANLIGLIPIISLAILPLIFVIGFFLRKQRSG